MTVFIGGALVNANGSLHLGHLIALLPGEVLASIFVCMTKMDAGEDP